MYCRDALYILLSRKTVFGKPVRLEQIDRPVTPVPGTLPSTLPSTLPRDLCLGIDGQLWDTFARLSLWGEALCIPEWCLFTERVDQGGAGRAARGAVYELLTDRPQSRRPLTWGRNHINLLLLEGKTFRCPWTARKIAGPEQYR